MEDFQVGWKEQNENEGEDVGGLQNTEVAYLLLAQQPRVLLPEFKKSEEKF